MSKTKKEKELLVRLCSSYDYPFSYPEGGYLEDLDFCKFKEELVNNVRQHIKAWTVIRFLQIESYKRYYDIKENFQLNIKDVDFDRIKMRIDVDFDGHDGEAIYTIAPYYLLIC